MRVATGEKSDVGVRGAGPPPEAGLLSHQPLPAGSWRLAHCHRPLSGACVVSELWPQSPSSPPCSAFLAWGLRRWPTTSCLGTSTASCGPCFMSQVPHMPCSSPFSACQVSPCSISGCTASDVRVSEMGFRDASRGLAESVL